MRSRMATGMALSCLLSLSVIVPCDAEDWNQFRGPVGGNEIGTATWPSSWGESNNIAWTTEIAGQGWSSPIIIGDRAYVTSAVSDEIGRPKGFGGGVAAMGSYRKNQGPEQPVSFQLACVNMADGNIEWTKEVGEARPPAFFHPSNTYATESPTSDGEFIYVYFQAVGMVACYDMSGEQVWEREFGAYKTGNDFGTGSSLAVFEGKLFVQNDNDEESFLVCLDTKTGNDLWRIERDSRTCWSSPLVWNSTAGVQIVVCGSSDVRGLDPATGDSIWRLTGMGGSFSSSPVADRDRVYFGNSGPGTKGPLVAVKATAKGELEVSKESDGIAWVKRASGPGMSSPVAHDGLIYVAGRGILTCHDAENGEEVYKSRLPGAASVAASLIMDQNRIVILNEEGTSFVVKPGRDFEVLEENETPGLFWSTPSANADSLLLRSADKVICIRNN